MKFLLEIIAGILIGVFLMAACTPEGFNVRVNGKAFQLQIGGGQ